MLKKTLALHFAESPPTEMIHNINSSRALSRLCFADPSKNGVKSVKYSPFASNVFFNISIKPVFSKSHALYAQFNELNLDLDICGNFENLTDKVQSNI